jgi:Anti-sigma-K factor rskA
VNCQDIADTFELYALGLAEDEERGEIEAHLARGCETCQANLREALAMNALMLASVPQAKPRARLKRRILAGFGIEPMRWGWLGALATACVAALAAWLSIQERHRADELARARQDLLAVRAERDRLQQIFGFLDQPDTQQVNFGQGQARGPRGTVLVNPKLGVLLLVGNLPPRPSGRTYEMWLIPRGGAPRPAGLFDAAPDGSALHVLPGPLDAASLGAVEVSVEPRNGSGAPATTPIIFAMISAP